MKIICCTKVHLDRMHIFSSLPDEIIANTHFVVHSKEQKNKLFGEGHREINMDHIHVTGIKQSLDALVDQRDWAERHLLEKGEWYIGLDDNIQSMTRYDSYYRGSDKADSTDRAMWKTPCERDFIELCQELRDKCNLVKTSYGGFEYNENPFFRQSKWKLMGYVRSKLFVKKARNILWRWHPKIGLMHDHAMSFMTMAVHGCVVHNRFVHVQRKMWEKGGLGTREERMPARIPTCEQLYKEFPDFVVPNPRTKEVDDPVCRLRGLKSMARWREANGYA